MGQDKCFHNVTHQLSSQTSACPQLQDADVLAQPQSHSMLVKVLSSCLWSTVHDLLIHHLEGQGKEKPCAKFAMKENF